MERIRTASIDQLYSCNHNHLWPYSSALEWRSCTRYGNKSEMTGCSRPFPHSLQGQFAVVFGDGHWGVKVWWILVWFVLDRTKSKWIGCYADCSEEA